MPNFVNKGKFIRYYIHVGIGYSKQMINYTFLATKNIVEIINLSRFGFCFQVLQRMIRSQKGQFPPFQMYAKAFKTDVKITHTVVPSRQSSIIILKTRIFLGKSSGQRRV